MTALILTALTMTLLGALTIRGTLFAAQPTRRTYWRMKSRLRPGPGFATAAEIHFHWSRWAATRHGRRARPSLTRSRMLTLPGTAYAVYLGRAQYGRKVYAPMEHQVLSIGPPRTLKSGILIARVADHPGPVLCTSTRADIYDHTAAIRGTLGPVDVFNPENVGDIPSTVSFDLLSGCENPATALRRANALVGPRSDTGDLAQWQAMAVNALTMFMHIAAVKRLTILNVWHWANNPVTGEGIFREVFGMTTSSKELLASFNQVAQDTRTAQSIRTIMADALASWIAIPEITTLISGPGHRPLDIPGFTRSNGTLYLITATADSPCAPIFRVIATEIHYHAGLAGSNAPAGRLDPPLLFALDEVCQICQVPLPEWFSDSAGKGILIEAVTHSPGQLRHRYGDHGAQTILDTCGTWRIYPGIKDHQTLEAISGLFGYHRNDNGKPTPSLPPDLIRRLPDHWVLIAQQNRSPVAVRGRPIWQRHTRRTTRTLPAPPNVLTEDTQPAPALTGEPAT